MQHLSELQSQRRRRCVPSSRNSRNSWGQSFSFHFLYARWSPAAHASGKTLLPVFYPRIHSEK